MNATKKNLQFCLKVELVFVKKIIMMIYFYYNPSEQTFLTISASVITYNTQRKESQNKKFDKIKLNTVL